MEPLQNRWVGLSGAVPTPQDFADWDWNDLDIRLTVSKVVERIFALGGNIVYGSHPTFLSIVEDAAMAIGTVGPKRVRMYVANLRRFFPIDKDFKKYYEQHDRYAEVIPINEGQDLDKTLTTLRSHLIETAEALVCVGGRAEGKGVQKIAGVGAEVQAALGKLPNPIPVYLAGATGGFTRRLVEQNVVTPDQMKLNGLSVEENSILTQQAGPWEATEFIVKGLTAYFAKHPQRS